MGTGTFPSVSSFVKLLRQASTDDHCSCAREVQRSKSILQSPAVSIFSEALRSPATVKAFKATDLLMSRHDDALDLLMSAEILRQSLDTWITLRAELASVILLLFTAMLTVSGIIPGTKAGLALGTTTTLAKSVYTLAWAATELEINMNSAERLETYYRDMPQEGGRYSVNSRSTPKNWPKSNTIKMKNVYLRYPSRPTPALDTINLTIKGGENVGIVGRTGMFWFTAYPSKLSSFPNILF
jgi:ABC-type multidrug transport system fused ATPase/permease subunit